MADVILAGFPNFDKLMIVKNAKTSGTFIANTKVTLTIAHNLGYIPSAFVVWTDEDDFRQFPLPTFINASIDTVNFKVTFKQWMNYAVDKTNLYIYLSDSNGLTDTVIFRYYLFRGRG